MSSSHSRAYTLIASIIKLLAQSYIRIKKPKVVAVAGSVGKTSTKLMLANFLLTKRVSYMDDSYNSGIGLYLSVFELKIPANLVSPIAWIKLIFQACLKFLRAGPDILLLEYGIDHPGEMNELVTFVKPDIAILTAVTPEHMEFMKTIDAVGEEETKILVAAQQFAIYNNDDVAQQYIPETNAKLYAYGSSNSITAHYTINEWQKHGARVSFKIADAHFTNLSVNFISEPLIRQLTGAALVAKILTVPDTEIASALESATPAASRMRVFDGISNSVIIDDTANFSPDAGVESLKALKQLPANRHIAVLGNMHELGEYADQGYADVANEFKDLNILALVGDMSKTRFGELARNMGFIENSTLFFYNTSIDAGVHLHDMLSDNDVVLVKGPFGDFYMEETVRILLKNKDDSRHLTRQSTFWRTKKKNHFGNKYK